MHGGYIKWFVYLGERMTGFIYDYLKCTDEIV